MANRSFKPTTGQNWFDATAWLGSPLPTSTDDVFINLALPASTAEVANFATNGTAFAKTVLVDNGNRLLVGAGGALNVAASITVGATSTSRASAMIVNTGGQVAVGSGAGTITVQSTGALFIGGAQTPAAFGTGVVQAKISLAAGGALVFNTSDNATFSAPISGDGSVRQTGAGTVITLTGANTLTGATQVQQGTLKAGAAGAFSATSATSVSTGAALDIGGFAQTIGPLTGQGAVKNSGAAARLTLGGASSTFDGDISVGEVRVNLDPGATLTLTGVNTTTGSVNLQRGTMALSGAGAVARVVGGAVGSGAVFDISATTSGATIKNLGDFAFTGGAVALGSRTLTISAAQSQAPFSGVIAGAGGITVSGGTQGLANVNTYTGATTITGGALRVLNDLAIAASSGVQVATGGTLDISGASVRVSIKTLADTAFGQSGRIVLGTKTLSVSAIGGAIFSGVISGAGVFQLAAGQQELKGANTYSGGTFVSSGLLVASATNALGTGLLDIDPTGQLDLRGFDQTVTTLSGGGTINNTGIRAVTLTLNGASDALFSGRIINTFDPVSLVKNGAGNQTLGANNGYSGGTTINQGTLTLVKNGAAGTGPVAFGPGARATLAFAAGVGVNVPVSGFASGDALDFIATPLAAGYRIALAGGANGVQTWALNSGATTLESFKLTGVHNASDFQIGASKQAGTSVKFFSHASKASRFDGGSTSGILWFNTPSGLALDWTMQNGLIKSGDNPIAAFDANSGWSLSGRADITGDGTTDILLRFQGGGQTLIGSWVLASGRFSSFKAIGGFADNSGWAFAGKGDFNGDATEDILLSFTSGGNVSLWNWRLANGAIQQTVDLNMSFGVTSGWSVIGAGDFNGDGISDVLFQNSQSGLVGDWAVTGAGTSGAFASIAGVAPNTGWNFDGVGDFNGDGTSDILWQNGSTLAIWEVLNGGLNRAVDVTAPAPAGFAFKGIGDYFGDGVSGVLWQNTTSGETQIWRMSNDQLVQTTAPGTVDPASGWRIVS